MKSALIINPASARLGNTRKVERIKQKLSRMGLAAACFLTSRPGEASILARKAVESGAGVILAAGGDGTLNEVINGMAESSASLGIIPTGVSNVLALELGIPINVDEALAVIIKGHTRKIDLGLINDRYFSLMAGIGFDARSVKMVNPVLKRYLKRYAYHLSGLKSMISAALPPFKISLNGDREETVYAAVISNARFYGGSHQINPRARLDDGRLHCCLFRKGKRRDYLRYFSGVLRKRHHTYSDVEITEIQSAQILTPSIPVQIDGDYFGDTPVRIEIRPGLFKLISPA